MNYVRNTWYVAGWAQDFELNKPVSIAILGEPVVIWRNSENALAALENRCVHRLAPLSLGRCEGQKLRCMYHGLLYDRTGAVTEIPGQDLIPPNAKVRAYPVREKHSWVWVWMGDAAKADRAAIPPSLALDDPGYRLKAGQLDYTAHYLLIDDNLLDLSHLSFAHEKTLGLDMPQWADQRPRLAPIERGLHFERWLADHPPRGFMKKTLGERVDVFNRYDFVFPGIFLQRTGFYPPGTAQASGGQAPEAAPLFWRIDEQAVTPIGPRASRYFYAAGARTDDIEPDRLERLFAVTEVAFNEDKTLIEAQQKLIDLDPERRMLPTSLDAGPTQFRKMVDGLARQPAG